MPTYVYGCNQNKDHPSVEIVHSVKEVIHTLCPQCGSPMHRIPQPFNYYMNPGLLLLDKMSDRFREYRTRRKHGNQRRVTS